MAMLDNQYNQHPFVKTIFNKVSLSLILCSFLSSGCSVQNNALSTALNETFNKSSDTSGDKSSDKSIAKNTKSSENDETNVGISLADIRNCRAKECLLDKGMQRIDSKELPNGAVVETYRGIAPCSMLTYVGDVDDNFMKLITLGLWEPAETQASNEMSKEMSRETSTEKSRETSKETHSRNVISKDNHTDKNGDSGNDRKYVIAKACFASKDSNLIQKLDIYGPSGQRASERDMRLK